VLSKLQVGRLVVASFPRYPDVLAITGHVVAAQQAVKLP
jgi:hypothetical protein